MPYNNTPIAPPKEYTGSVSLPLARVKKIIQTDDDIQQCSNNAAFVITIATEMFIQHLVERTHEIVKAEKRPRRNIQYADVANAVARLDSLEFLSDVVPRTTTLSKYTERKKRAAEATARALEASPVQPPAPGPSSSSLTHSRNPSSSVPLYANGSLHSPSHSFQGPGARSMLDDGEGMDVEYSAPQPQHPPLPNPTMQTSSLQNTSLQHPPLPQLPFQQQPVRSVVPSTLELLERAKAAQARANSAVQSPSPRLSGPPS